MAKKASGKGLIQRRGVSGQAESPTALQASQQQWQVGWRAFQAGRYAEALKVWEGLALSEPSDRRLAVLAEAHLRQAAIEGFGVTALPNLERAVKLMPADSLYNYYWGLGLHKAGRIDEALAAYERAVANGLSRPGAGLVIGLALLERDPQADLGAAPGISVEVRQLLEPLAAFLQGNLQAKSLATSSTTERNRATGQVARPWQVVFDGLAALADNKPDQAHQLLTGVEGKFLPRPVNALRWHYVGVIAAREGDMAAAAEAWKQAHQAQPDHVSVRQNLAAVHARQAAAHARAEEWPAAAGSAMAGLRVTPGDAALSQLALTALDRVAHQAAQAGDWAAAVQSWTQARQVLGGMRGGGSPRPLLHNLALAYEALTQWEDAAETWRTMLRTRPKKPTQTGLTEAHWMWVRTRVIECYRHAGRPDRAIAVFRQALKTNPGDADLQLDLAEALLATGRSQAAMDTLDALVTQHPTHIPARVRLAEVYAILGLWLDAESTLRPALALDPNRPELRRRMVHILTERGQMLAQRKELDQARALFEEAITYAPDDYDLYFHLARIEFDGRRPEPARAYLERGLDLGKDASDAYEQAFCIWVVEDDLDEAQRVLARGEASGKLQPDFFVHSGIFCLARANPPPALPDPSTLWSNRSKPHHRPERKSTPVEQLGHTLLERGVALGPETEVLQHIATELRMVDPGLAITYAQRLVKHLPKDPHAHALLGMLLGMDSQGQKARDVLRQAERLARQQGNPELAMQLRELSEAVTSPFFATMARMGSAFEAFEFYPD